MSESIQNMQIRALVAKAAEERDKARAEVITLVRMWRYERKWMRIFLVLCMLEATAIGILVS